jgi:hypothetical protein
VCNASFMRRRFWPPLLLLLAACSRPSPVEVDLRPMNEADLADDSEENELKAEPALPASPTIDYFPPSPSDPSITCNYGGPTPVPIVSDHERRWYSRHLAAADEPSFYLASRGPGAAEAESLRFTWLRSFHAPVIVRVERTGPNEQRLIAVMLSGAGGYDPGKVKHRIDRRLTADEAAGLRATLARTRLFEQPAKACGSGVDGAQWIFEAVDDGGYRFMDRWTPSSGPIREAGLFLLKLTGWKLDPVY